MMIPNIQSWIKNAIIPTILHQWYILLLGLLCAPLFSNAQQFISLEKAIETARQNNLVVKNEALRSEYAKALINTSNDIPKTTIMGEFGQINSFYADTKIGLSQSIAFPTIYKKQKQLYNEAWKAAVMQISLREMELKKAVTQNFYTYLNLKEKEKLLQKADTLFSNFYRKANLRLQKGESNVLEKTTAESQKANINMQLRQLQQEIEVTLLGFQLLLNSPQKYIPNPKDTKATLTLITDTNAIYKNTLLQILLQQKEVAIAQTALEKSKLLPDLNFGYNNMSMKGTGSDNKTYTPKTRFQSAQIGVNVPLFTSSQKARIKAAQIAEKITESEYNTEKQKLYNQYQQLIATYQSNAEIVQYYETQGNANAKIITETANRQFQNGEINYLDWVMLVHQSLSIENNYLESLKILQQNIIDINYILKQ